MSKSLRTPLHQRLQDLLVALRKSKNLTQADLAFKLGRPQSFVAKSEGGERRLDVVEFIEVAYALEIDPSKMLADLIRSSPESQSGEI
jgi:transcriptional regulator with XRE-family HTH domain